MEVRVVSSRGCHNVITCDKDSNAVRNLFSEEEDGWRQAVLASPCLHPSDLTPDRPECAERWEGRAERVHPKAVVPWTPCGLAGVISPALVLDDRPSPCRVRGRGPGSLEGRVRLSPPHHPPVRTQPAGRSQGCPQRPQVPRHPRRQTQGLQSGRGGSGLGRGAERGGAGSGSRGRARTPRRARPAPLAGSARPRPSGRLAPPT